MNTRHQAHKPINKCNYWGPNRNRHSSRAPACQIPWR